MQKLFVVLFAIVVGLGTVGCKPDEATDTAKDVTCQLVEPVVAAVATKLRAGATVTAGLIVAATGIALSAACTYLLDRLGAAPDEEHDVVLESGKGLESAKISGKTFISVTDKWCNTTGGCTGYDRCPTDWVCLFTGSEGTGKMSLFTTGSPNLADQHIDAAAISVFNRTGKIATLYAARDYHGETYTVAKTAKGDLPAEWRGKARSIIVGTPKTSSTTATRTSPTTTKSTTTRTTSVTPSPGASTTR
ncbi:peptidase inhibitor family I36 protein [Nocardia sp. NPDC050630]|uniref:peptidase inhibitor family I36 protein n=1 Tax=Nocardia sp. NPDC050630 TaxID=3364321 RepID=UPI00379EF88E